VRNAHERRRALTARTRSRRVSLPCLETRCPHAQWPSNPPELLMQTWLQHTPGLCRSHGPLLGTQELTQAPLVQIWPDAHVLPHLPQLFTSVCRFTQVPLHSRSMSASHCAHKPVWWAPSETHWPRCGPGGNACWQKWAQLEFPPPSGVLPVEDVPAGGSGLIEGDRPPPLHPTPSEVSAKAAKAPPTRRTASRRGIPSTSATVFAKTSKRTVHDDTPAAAQRPDRACVGDQYSRSRTNGEGFDVWTARCARALHRTALLEPKGIPSPKRRRAEQGVGLTSARAALLPGVPPPRSAPPDSPHRTATVKARCALRP
jgi:hypothetical protein